VQCKSNGRGNCFVVGRRKLCRRRCRCTCFYNRQNPRQQVYEHRNQRQRQENRIAGGHVGRGNPPGVLASRDVDRVVLAVASFGLVAIAQSMFPLWAYHPAAAGLRVHLSNGLYANAVLDRILGGWSVRKTS